MTAAAESVLRAGHPWLFAESIRDQNRPGTLGEIAVVYDRKDRFLAAGLFDPESPIRFRVLHSGKPAPLDQSWWRDRLQQALRRRQGLFDSQTTGYRCLHGESDGWPGLVLDRYDTTLVLKLYTAAWLPHLEHLLPLFRRLPVSNDLPNETANAAASANDFKITRIVLRLSRNIQALALERFGQKDGQLLFGPPLEKPVTFLETSLRFEADVIHGQKTGFFLDQRENRRLVEGLAHGRDVLNAFSFSGGFSLYAARGGARSTTDLDISPHALESAERNFALNADLPTLSACRRQFIQADAFDWLRHKPRRKFDLIILDPPSLAKRKSEKPAALRAYTNLIHAALGWLQPGGILVACSCSAHVAAEEFYEVVRQAASGLREFLKTTHPPDHPASFPEAHYLKAIYLRRP